MTTPGSPYLFALALLLAAVVGWALGRSMRARATERDRISTAQRLTAAETRAGAETARREELGEGLRRAEQTIRELDRELAVAREQSEVAAQLMHEQKAFVAGARAELQASFEALAARALQGSSEQLLALAQQRLATERVQAAADLDERRIAIESLMQPLSEALLKLDQRTGDLESARVGAYSRIEQHIEILRNATSSLEEKTTSLAAALRGSEAKGRWGEIALRNVVELAGMTEHCDFEEQQTLPNGSRPDMTVRLPGDRRIAIDAKAPLNAYLDAAGSSDSARRDAALMRHARALRTHMRTLAARDYAAALDAELDLVVLFLPGDPYLSAAFAVDPDLQIDALRSKVLIATPTTLIALLRTVAIYWQQQTLAENAQLIAATARELYERAAKFGEELAGVRRGLQMALEAYNRAVGSFDRRLMPMARRLEELKIAEQTRRDLTPPEPILEAPRLARHDDD